MTNNIIDFANRKSTFSRLFKTSVTAVIAAMIGLTATGAAFAGTTNCSRSEITRLERSFFSEMNTQAPQIVWLGNSKSARITACSKYSDGFVVEGRFHLYGTDDSYYWLDGKMSATKYLAPLQVRVDDANGNFQRLAVIKAVAIVGTVAAACSAEGSC